MSRLRAERINPFRSRKSGSMALLCLLLVVQLVLVVCAPAIAAGESTVMAVGGLSNVRAGAGTDSTVIGSAPAGSEYTYLSQGKDANGTIWYKIQYTPAEEGWICSSNSCRLTAAVKEDPRSFIDTVARKYGAVGVQVATVNGGIPDDNYSWGWAIKNKTAMTDAHKTRTASLSKVIIAMTAMKMQEEGIVTLDTPVSNYWGVSTPKAITLRHLLSHTSTLASLSVGNSPAEIRSQLSRSGSYTSGTPGTASVWRYSNYGAAVGATSLEMASGRVIDTYADEKIFNSLGIDAAWMSGRVNTSLLTSTYYADDSLGRSAATSATLVGSNSPGYNGAYYAGGFTCSAADYARLIAVLANDGALDGVRYLESSSVKKMETPIVSASEHGGSFSQCLALRYKAGLYGRSGIYYHTGNAYGVLSLASYDGATRDGVVVITTGCTQGRDAQGIYSVCSIISEYFYDYMEAHPRVPATDIALEQDTVTLELGQSMQLKAILTPADSDSEVTWQSSEPRCVTVSAGGKVTAVGHGSAVITVSAEGHTARCKVKVAPPDIKLNMLGAGVRVTEPYGIRFGVELLKDEEFRSADVVEYGTIIIGKGNLGSQNLTIHTEGITRIRADKIYSETAQSLVYTGVITGIPRESFDTELVGRGYLIYRDADRTVHLVYSDTATRSFSSVANAAYQSYLEITDPDEGVLYMLERLREILGVEQTVDTEVQNGIDQAPPVSCTDLPAVSSADVTVQQESPVLSCTDLPVSGTDGQ